MEVKEDRFGFHFPGGGSVPSTGFLAARLIKAWHRFQKFSHQLTMKLPLPCFNDDLTTDWVARRARSPLLKDWLDRLQEKFWKHFATNHLGNRLNVGLAQSSSFLSINPTLVGRIRQQEAFHNQYETVTRYSSRYSQVNILKMEVL